MLEQPSTSVGLAQQPVLPSPQIVSPTLNRCISSSVESKHGYAVARHHYSVVPYLHSVLRGHDELKQLGSAAVDKLLHGREIADHAKPAATETQPAKRLLKYDA